MKNIPHNTEEEKISDYVVLYDRMYSNGYMPLLLYVVEKCRIMMHTICTFNMAYKRIILKKSTTSLFKKKLRKIVIEF